MKAKRNTRGAAVLAALFILVSVPAAGADTFDVIVNDVYDGGQVFTGVREDPLAVGREMTDVRIKTGPGVTLGGMPDLGDIGPGDRLVVTATESFEGTWIASRILKSAGGEA